MFYHSSIGATANLLLSAQRNAFSLTSSTCKKLNNDERSVTKDIYLVYFSEMIQNFFDTFLVLVELG